MPSEFYPTFESDDTGGLGVRFWEDPAPGRRHDYLDLGSQWQRRERTPVAPDARNGGRH